MSLVPLITTLQIKGNVNLNKCQAIRKKEYWYDSVSMTVWGKLFENQEELFYKYPIDVKVIESVNLSSAFWESYRTILEIGGERLSFNSKPLHTVCTGRKKVRLDFLMSKNKHIEAIVID